MLLTPSPLRLLPRLPLQVPFMSQQQAADQLAASAYMAQMVAGLPHAAGLQHAALPPAVLQSIIEGRGYTWGADPAGNPGSRGDTLRQEGGAFSPANGGSAHGGSGNGGSAGGGSAGGGSGGTHSSGAMSQGPVGGSSPSNSASGSEDEVEGERSNPSKEHFKGNGRSSSGSGGTEGTSEKEGRPPQSLPLSHLMGTAPGSSSAFTSFARWPAHPPSAVWPQQQQTVDSANYRAVREAAAAAGVASLRSAGKPRGKLQPQHQACRRRSLRFR